jgi:hypothetical protein
MTTAVEVFQLNQLIGSRNRYIMTVVRTGPLINSHPGFRAPAEHVSVFDCTKLLSNRIRKWQPAAS